LAGHERYCLLDPRIGAAAAEVARHLMPDLLTRRLGVRGHERRGRDDLSRRAEPRLDGIGLHERLDERVIAETLDRRHLAVDGVHERDARERRDAVDEDGAGAAVTLAARDLRPGQPDVLAQDLRERATDGGLDRVPTAVDRELTLHW